MLSTLLAAATHHSDVDFEGLIVCLLVALLVGVVAFAISSVVPPLVRFANVIGLCVGALAFLACWF